MAPEFYLPMRRLAAAYHEKQLGEAAEAGLEALPEPARTRLQSRLLGTGASSPGTQPQPST